MKSNRELLFFVETNKVNVEIEEMSHHKLARHYMNRFTINKDDQYEISQFEEMNTDWEDGRQPENLHDRINKLVNSISAKSLDIFFFGWYEFYHTLTEERFHLGNVSPLMIFDITGTLFPFSFSIQNTV